MPLSYPLSVFCSLCLPGVSSLSCLFLAVIGVCLVVYLTHATLRSLKYCSVHCSNWLIFFLCVFAWIFSPPVLTRASVCLRSVMLSPSVCRSVFIPGLSPHSRFVLIHIGSLDLCLSPLWGIFIERFSSLCCPAGGWNLGHKMPTKNQKLLTIAYFIHYWKMKRKQGLNLITRKLILSSFNSTSLYQLWPVVVM